MCTFSYSQSRNRNRKDSNVIIILCELLQIMRLINTLIVVVLCVKSLIQALPVQSKPLENVDDQLFWQAAWFSHDSEASPFTHGDSKRISPKSIFIIPEKASSFGSSATAYCQPGYRIHNGKCIAIVNIKQPSEDTKFANLISEDDTTHFDYGDYFDEEDEYMQSSDDDQLKLPLVPILNESNENENNDDKINNNYNDDAKKVTIREHEVTTLTSVSDDRLITAAPYTFHADNKTDSVQVIITTLSNDDYEWEMMNTSSGSNNNNNNTTTYEHDTATSANEFKNSTAMNENFLTTSTVATTTSTEFMFENITENENIEPTTQKQQKQQQTTAFSTDERGSDNNSSAFDESNGEIDENSQTEETIIESSDTISDDGDVTFLLNDSLLIDYNASSDSGNMSVDEFFFTTLEPIVDGDDDETTTEELQTVITSTQEQMQTNEELMNNDDNSTLTATTSDLFAENETTTSSDEDENTSEQDDLDKKTFAYESYSTEADSTNKFVFHHLTSVGDFVSTSVGDFVSTTERNKFVFPMEEIKNRIRFPDDSAPVATSNRPVTTTSSSSSGFSWPRDNQRITTNIFQFWNQQPLIRDNVQRTRENSKSFRTDSFFPYTKKVQLLQSPLLQRYNYK